jgi:hypothetical protein
MALILPRLVTPANGWLGKEVRVRPLCADDRFSGAGGQVGLLSVE